MDFWSLGRSNRHELMESQEGGQEAWTLGISKGSESHGLMESQEKLGTWTLGVFERKRETWTAEVTKESWCCGLLESREGDRDMDSWSLSKGRKRRGLLESQEEAGDMDPWGLGREREAWTHGVSKRGGGQEAWTLGVSREKRWTWTFGVARGSEGHGLPKSRARARDVDSWSL